MSKLYFRGNEICCVLSVGLRSIKLVDYLIELSLLYIDIETIKLELALTNEPQSNQKLTLIQFN